MAPSITKSLAIIRAGLTAPRPSVKQAPPSPLSSSWFGRPWWLVPAGHVDVSTVGEGWGNSIVFAALTVKARAFTEAPLTVQEKQEGEWVEVEDHPIGRLWNRPNQYMVGAHLGAHIIMQVDIAGDAYVVKARNGLGAVVELWPINAAYTRPLDWSELSPSEREQTGAEPGALIAAYEYQVNGRRVLFSPSEVIHFRRFISPDNPRLGMSPVKTVLREVLGDEEAGQYATALLRNMGVPGVIITPVGEYATGPNESEAQAMIADFKQKFGGSRRGEPMIASGGPLKIEQVSINPTDMDFRTLRRVPEERITGVLGVPAILAGMGAGLDRATYSNASTLREFMTEQTIVPDWTLFSDIITHSLRDDFSLTAQQRSRFDTSEVRALQDDEDKVTARAQQQVAAGFATVADARRATGLPVEDHHDVFLRAASVIEVPNEPNPGDDLDATIDQLEGAAAS